MEQNIPTDTEEGEIIENELPVNATVTLAVPPKSKHVSVYPCTYTVFSSEIFQVKNQERKARRDARYTTSIKLPEANADEIFLAQV